MSTLSEKQKIFLAKKEYTIKDIDISKQINVESVRIGYVSDIINDETDQNSFLLPINTK